MVLAVTVGAALSRHPARALPSAPPRHSASGTVAAPPARPPSPASPSRKARRPGPGDTGMVQVAASDHRTVTAPGSGREKTRRHRHGKDAGHGNRNGHGHENRNGNGHGHGHENRDGNAPVLSVLSYFDLKNFGRDCRQPERDDGLDPLG